MITPEKERRKMLERIQCRYYIASGTDIRDCLILGRRYDETTGFQAHRSESWVCRTEHVGNEDGFELITEFFSDVLIWGAWRSSCGACFVVGSQVSYHPDPRTDPDGSRWIHQDFPPFVLMKGVWGLDDGPVYLWGSEWEGEGKMYEWHENGLEEMAAPPFHISSLHGVSSDCLYAAGEGGGIANWDGKTWHTLNIPTSEYLTGIYVASRDKIWAIGGGGSILEGSPKTWKIIAKAPQQPKTKAPVSLLAIAYWNEGLWIGTGDGGLWKRKGTSHEFECIKPEVRALTLDARGPLLICEKNRVTSTQDGENFLSAAERSLEKFREHVLLLEDF